MSVQFLLQQCLIGLTNGALIALVALGYTMVYGIIGLINFAHGDLIMLGACLALSLVGALGMTAAGPATTWVGIGGLVLLCGLFCGLLNVAVDRIVYKPLRNAPKLAPLVSAIGVSFIFMNVGLFWLGPADKSFPELLPSTNLLHNDALQFRQQTQQQCETLIARARHEATTVQEGANHYAEQVLGELEGRLKELSQVVLGGRRELVRLQTVDPKPANRSADLVPADQEEPMNRARRAAGRLRRAASRGLAS